MSTLNIDKKHYNAVILLTSFVDRLNYQALKIQELKGITEAPNFIYTENLMTLLGAIKENGALNAEQCSLFFEIHNEINNLFKQFYSNTGDPFEHKLSSLYASFMAERTMQEHLAKLNLALDVPSKTNYIAQIAFYDEQLLHINQICRDYAAGQGVAQKNKIHIDRLYQNLLSIKPHLMDTLNNVVQLVIKQ